MVVFPRFSPSHVWRNNQEDTNPLYLRAHDIMALFFHRKRILQTRMRSHPVGLDV